MGQRLAVRGEVDGAAAGLQRVVERLRGGGRRRGGQRKVMGQLGRGLMDGSLVGGERNLATRAVLDERVAAGRSC